MTKETINEIDVQSVMTKSTLPVGGYSVNPYVGCLHACKYCYASFMKRFTGHPEPWGTFLDVKRTRQVFVVSIPLFGEAVAADDDGSKSWKALNAEVLDE